jgi:hypothetical protein
MISKNKKINKKIKKKTLIEKPKKKYLIGIEPIRY